MRAIDVLEKFRRIDELRKEASDAERARFEALDDKLEKISDEKAKIRNQISSEPEENKRKILYDKLDRLKSQGERIQNMKRDMQNKFRKLR